MANHNPPTNGLDKRPAAINRKGRPKSFDKWRELLIELSNEPAVQRDKENNVKKLVLIQVPKVIDGKPVLDEAGHPVMIDHYATNAEMVARQWMSDPKNQERFIEGAFGKVPQAVDLTSGGKSLVIDYGIFNLDELNRIRNGESETVVYADALQRLATSQSSG